MAGLGDLFQFQNPFQPNPNFNVSESNFIENGISNGIEKGLGNVGDKLMLKGQVKLESFAHNLPQLVSIALMSYLIYLGYKTFVKKNPPDFSNVYTSLMIYTIFRLFWKVVLHI